MLKTRCLALTALCLSALTLAPSASAAPQATESLQQFRLSPPPAHSVEGRPLTVYRFGQGEQEYIFLFGAFHGDEPQGPYLLERLLEVLAEHPAYYQDKTIFVMPVVNPDGLAAQERVNAHQVDLNRNFPTRNFKPGGGLHTRYYAGPAALSEPESRAVFNLLAPYLERARPEQIKILSIHAPLAVNNYDGPAKALAERLQEYNHYAPLANIGYPTPGSFGTYYGKERGLKVITLETSKEGPEQAWMRHREALLALLQFPDRELYPQIQPELPPIPVQPLPSASPSDLVEPGTFYWWPRRRGGEAPESSEHSPFRFPQPQPSESATSDAAQQDLAQALLEAELPVPLLSPLAIPRPISVAPTKPLSQARAQLPARLSLSKAAWLQVSKAHQELKVIDQGKTLAVFPVSTGATKRDTPSGSFRILTKVVAPRYAGSPHLGKRVYAPLEVHNPLGTRWMQINAWHYQTGAMLGIHGTDEPELLGQAVSGGCVRMRNQDVEKLFEYLHPGMKVVISDK